MEYGDESAPRCSRHPYADRSVVDRVRVGFRLAKATALAACVVAAGGCMTPPPDTRVAATYSDEDPIEISAYVCKNYQVNLIQVFERGSNTEGAAWETGPPVGESEYAERAHMIKVRIFQQPEGWVVLESSLTHLKRGVPYALAFSTVQGQTSRIRFTLEDLEQLGDRVWTGRTGEERAVSEAEFVEMVKAGCD